MKRLLLAAAAALLTVDAGHAQSLELDTRHIHAGTDSMVAYLVRGTDTTDAGWSRDEIRIASEGGRRVVRRIYALSGQLTGTRTETLVDDGATLAPLRVRGTDARGSTSLAFAPGRVKGWTRSPAGDSVAVDVALTRGVFNSATLDLVLRAAPLRYGWTADIPVFIASTGQVATIRAKVAGLESMDGISCWRVNADFNGLPVSFWIDRESRAMVRQVMTLGPDTRLVFRLARP